MVRSVQIGTLSSAGRSGRKPRVETPRPYPNNVRELREAAGLSPKEAAAEAGLSRSYYAMIEGERRRLNRDTAEKLAPALRTNAGALFERSVRVMLPVRYKIAAQESENAPLEWEATEPMEYERAPRRLLDPEGCFIADLEDDSADIDYCAGTRFCVRPLEQLGEQLALGAKIIVKFLLDPLGSPREPRTQEVLYGRLDRTLTGDLVLLTQSSNPLIGRVRVVQDGSRRLRALDERLLQAIPQPAVVDYVPRDGDMALILGVVVRIVDAPP